MIDRTLDAQPLTHRRQFLLRSLRKRLETCTGNRAMAFVVGRHSIDGSINQIEELKPELDPVPCDSFLLGWGMSFDLDNLKAGSIVEELPSGKYREQRKSIFILKALKAICAGTQENQIRERPLSNEGFQNNRRRGREVRGVPIEQFHYEQTAGESQLLPESQSQTDGCACVCFFNRPRLGTVAPERDNHCKNGTDRSSPAAYGRYGRPIKVAGSAALNAWSQILEFGQLQFPLWTGRHSAMACHHQETAHG